MGAQVEAHYSAATIRGVVDQAERLFRGGMPDNHAGLKVDYNLYDGDNGHLTGTIIIGTPLETASLALRGGEYAELGLWTETSVDLTTAMEVPPPHAVTLLTNGSVEVTGSKDPVRRLQRALDSLQEAQDNKIYRRAV